MHALHALACTQLNILVSPKNRPVELSSISTSAQLACFDTWWRVWPTDLISISFSYFLLSPRCHHSVDRRTECQTRLVKSRESREISWNLVKSRESRDMFSCIISCFLMNAWARLLTSHAVDYIISQLDHHNSAENQNYAIFYGGRLAII